MAYFEYHLPDAAPDYLDVSIATRFENVMRSIKTRMDKLEAALDMTLMRGEDFAPIAKKLFDAFPERFDAMTAAEIAGTVTAMATGKEAAEDRITFPNAIVVVDSAFCTTREWEMLRHIGIGGSDAAIVQTISPYRTQRELYCDKRGIPEKLKSEDSGFIFERGHILEDRVVDAYCKVTGAKRIPETRMFQSKTHPHCTANIDSLIQFPTGKLYVFESKTTVEENRLAWTGDKVPAHYIPQTQQYPAVLADERIAGTYIGCLFTKDYEVGGVYLGSDYDERKFLVRLVERNEAAEKAVLDANEWFWQNYIEAEVPPPNSRNPEKDIQVVRKYTGPADKSIPAVAFDSEEFRVLADRYLDYATLQKEAQDKADEYKARKDEISLAFIEKLGPAMEGAIPYSQDEFIQIAYKPRKRTVTDMETLELKYPDAFNECVSVNPEASRVFSLKKKLIPASKKTAKAVV